jgi:cold shock CspA family protein
MYHLKQPTYDAPLVENHLRNSFSMGDHAFENRFLLAQYLFLRGDVVEAASVFDQINSKAPDNFRRTGMREDNVITARLERISGIVETMKDRFLFIRAGSYPESIFAHHSEIDPDLLDDLSVGTDVNFNVRFNRAGPIAVGMKKGRSSPTSEQP